MMAATAGRPMVGREAGVGGTGRAALVFGRRLAARQRTFLPRHFRSAAMPLRTQAAARGSRRAGLNLAAQPARFGDPPALDWVFRNLGISRAFYAWTIRSTLSLSLSTLAQHLRVWQIQAPTAQFVLRVEARSAQPGPATPGLGTSGVWLRAGVYEAAAPGGAATLLTRVRRGWPEALVSVTEPMRTAFPMDEAPGLAPAQGSLAANLYAWVAFAGGPAVTGRGAGAAQMSASGPAVAQAEAVASILMPGAAAPATAPGAAQRVSTALLVGRAPVGTPQTTVAAMPRAQAAPPDYVGARRELILRSLAGAGLVPIAVAATTQTLPPGDPRARPEPAAVRSLAKPEPMTIPATRLAQASLPPPGEAPVRRSWSITERPAPASIATMTSVEIFVQSLAAAQRAPAIAASPDAGLFLAPLGVRWPLLRSLASEAAALAGDEAILDDGSAGPATLPLVRPLPERAMAAQAAAFVYAAPPNAPAASQPAILQRTEREVVELVRHEVEQALQHEPVLARFSRADYAEIADQVFSTMTRRIAAERERLGR